MNNLTKTIMTIAVAGSLLFGGVMTSQAADYFSTSQDSTDGQRGNQRSGELANTIGTEREQINPLLNPLDDFLNNPDDHGDPNPFICIATGKITKLSVHFETGHTQIRIFSVEKDISFYFDMNDSSPSRQWDILQAAWIHSVEVTLNSDIPCEGSKANYGGIVSTINIGPNQTE